MKSKLTKEKKLNMEEIGATSPLNTMDIVINESFSTEMPSSESFSERCVKVGSILKEARLRGRPRDGIILTEEEMGNIIRIRKECIEMLEVGNYQELSRITYYYGCVRGVANELGLPSDGILNYLIEADPHYAHVALNKNSGKRSSVRVERGANNNIVTNEASSNKNATKNTTSSIVSQKNILIIAGLIFFLVAMSRLTSRPNPKSAGERFLIETTQTAEPTTAKS